MRLKLSLRSTLEVWRWHHFSIFVDNIKNRFVVYSTISHYSQTAWKVSSVKGQHDWTNLKQSFQAESTYIFLRTFFSRKIAVYYKILSEATTRKFRKILGNVTNWRSAMILKKRRRLRVFFYDFVKQFHSSNS